MEPTARFGRRTANQPSWGAAPHPAAAPPAAGPRVTHWLKPYEPPTPVAERVAPDESKGLPVVTVGIIAVLALILWQQLAHAFSIDGHLDVGISSWAAEGAASRALVLKQGEWWRILTAPMLHGGLGHLVGNCVALFFVGWYLERLIGHAWFAAVYFVCGLGGEFASLLVGPESIGVGASGAIMGLFGAAFVCSFHVEAHEGRGLAQWRLMRWSLPSLIPHHTDGPVAVGYVAHAGGAMAGVLIGFLILVLWPENRRRPRFGEVAGALAIAALAVSALALCLVAAKFPTYQQAVARFIPASQITDDNQVMASRSADLVEHYPDDPRSHYYRALYWLNLREADPAIGELRAGISAPPDQTDTVSPALQPSMRLMLASMLVALHRQGEARDAVGVACDYPFEPPKLVKLVREFRDTGVCPWQPGTPP